MSSDFQTPNPYVSPYGHQPLPRPPFASGKVVAPAIVLLIIGCLGIAASTYNVIYAFGEPKVDPNLPLILQEMEKGARGPGVAAMQAGFMLANAFVILGAVQMMRLKMWGLGVAASIVAMINFGTFCCVLGFPVGVWSLIVLMMEDVKREFQSPAQW